MGLQKVVIFKIVEVFTCGVTGMRRDLIREKGTDLVRIKGEDEDAMIPLSLSPLLPSPLALPAFRHTQSSPLNVFVISSRHLVYLLPFKAKFLLK